MNANRDRQSKDTFCRDILQLRWPSLSYKRAKQSFQWVIGLKLLSSLLLKLISRTKNPNRVLVVPSAQSDSAIKRLSQAVWFALRPPRLFKSRVY